MSSPESAHLQALLESELTTLRQLETAIETEHQALLTSDVAALESATREKNAAIATHRAQQEQRLGWMNSMGLGSSTLAELVSHCGNDPASRDLQQALGSLAASCQEHNRRNGGLIVRLQERTRGALDVLRRDDANPELYSFSGSREQHSDSRTLGKA